MTRSVVSLISQLTLVPDAARKPVSNAIKTTFFRDSRFEHTLRPGISSPFSILRPARRAAAHSPLTTLPTNAAVVTSDTVGAGGPLYRTCLRP